ncbi:unnamed protein product, partial [Owenia fusiformis]
IVTIAIILAIVSIVAATHVQEVQPIPAPPDITPTMFPPPKIVHYATWTTWESWSDCSTSCGNGTKLRSRTCKIPTRGTQNVIKCKGDSSQIQQCTLGLCP